MKFTLLSHLTPVILMEKKKLLGPQTHLNCFFLKLPESLGLIFDSGKEKLTVCSRVLSLVSAPTRHGAEPARTLKGTVFHSVSLRWLVVIVLVSPVPICLF